MEKISSRTNERVKQTASLISERALRRERSLCVAEGFKLCAEALRLGLALEELWISESALEKHRNEAEALIQAAGSSVLMSESVAQKLSEQKSPQGVLAVLRLPEMNSPQALKDAKRVAALVSVQDPVNLGAVARSAAAFGYALALTSDCADPFSPKTLRASMGATLALKIADCGTPLEMLSAFKEMGFETPAAALDEKAEKLGAFKQKEPFAVFIGSEGQGLPRELVAGCSRSVMIPIGGEVESLNAASAAAVLMWELQK